MQSVVDWVLSYLNVSPQVQSKALASLFIILMLWLLRWLTIQFISRRTEDVGIRYRWRKTSAYLVSVLGVFLVGRMWLAGIQSLATFLGLVSAGLAIALQVPVTNLAGWVFIMWRHPFGVGDRVEIGGYTGDVIDIGIFEFTLLEVGNWVAADQSTGRIMHIPNGKVFSEVVANYSKGFEYIWNEIPVLVTFESDWEKAKVILQEIADRNAAHLAPAVEERIRHAARRYMIMYPSLSPIVYTRVEASGVLLTIRYLCEPRQRRSSEHAIWEDILRAFAAHPELEFAYPTQRFYNRWVEGRQDVESRPERHGAER